MSDMHPTGRHGHEESDAHPRPIAVFEIGLLAGLVIAALLMAGLFSYFTGREAELDVGGSPLAKTRGTASGPRLQTTPSSDLETMRARDRERLTSYAWVDEAQGIVRIPIERAMDIVAERGLPLREGTEEGTE